MEHKIMTVERFKKEVGIHITVNHNGKMSGMQSLSTSCVNNEYCQKYSKDKDKICSKCYAQRQLKMYPAMNNCLNKNADILCSRILNKNELPFINAAYFRLESFADLNNDIQLINYFNICKANPHVKFALWSKNLFIIEDVIKKGHNKPKNLNIVASSFYINKTTDVSKYDFVDRLFTVYSKDYIEENNVEINCGSKSCLACLRCYKKSNKEFYINEKLK